MAGYVHVVATHMKVQKLISCKQWGFQSGKSTTTALIEVVHCWLDGYLDCGSDVAAVFKKLLIAFHTDFLLKN